METDLWCPLLWIRCREDIPGTSHKYPADVLRRRPTDVEVWTPRDIPGSIVTDVRTGRRRDVVGISAMEYPTGRSWDERRTSARDVITGRDGTSVGCRRDVGMVVLDRPLDQYGMFTRGVMGRPLDHLRISSCSAYNWPPINQFICALYGSKLYKLTQ